MAKMISQQWTSNRQSWRNLTKHNPTPTPSFFSCFPVHVAAWGLWDGRGDKQWGKQKHIHKILESFWESTKSNVFLCLQRRNSDHTLVWMLNFVCHNRFSSIRTTGDFINFWLIECRTAWEADGKVTFLKTLWTPSNSNYKAMHLFYANCNHKFIVATLITV